MNLRIIKTSDERERNPRVMLFNMQKEGKPVDHRQKQIRENKIDSCSSRQQIDCCASIRSFPAIETVFE
jgi:hypothetical protein